MNRPPISRDALLAELTRVLRLIDFPEAEVALRDLEIWTADDFSARPTLPIGALLRDLRAAIEGALGNRGIALFTELDGHVADVRRLAEVAGWCARRAAVTNPRDSLRSPELAPPARELESYLSPYIVESLVARRSRLLENEVLRPVPPDAGRIVAHVQNDCTNMGEFGDPEEDPRCYFDEQDHPPWDTWIQTIGSEDPTVIAWVPRVMLPFVEEAVAISATSCIRWLDRNVLNVADEIPVCFWRLT